MKEKIMTVTLGTLLMLSASHTVSFAASNDEAAKPTQVTNQADVTLKAGSGEDVRPVVPDDTHDDHPDTGNKGALSIPYASNITFGEQEIKAQDTDYFALNKKPHVQVNDTRGGAKGWTLGVTITPFKGMQNSKPLVGAQLALLNGQVVTKNNDSKAPELVQTSDNAYILNSDIQNIMVAKSGQGAGAFAAVFAGEDGANKNVRLHVPRAGVEAQKYSAEMTWVLTDAPA